MKPRSTKKYTLWFSQGCLIVFALLLLYLDIRGYWIVKWFLGVSHGHGGTRDCIAFMSTIYACSVCAWIAVVELWLLLRLVTKGEAFSRESVRYLRITSWCCFAVAAITLLREIESIAPMEYYIGLQAIREEGEDELADNALDSLSSMGEKAVDAMRKALPLASPNGQEAMLTVLSGYPGDENVFQTALSLFNSRRESVAILADCLGKLGDERALPALKALAASEETPYLDYIELRSAIEALGGEAPERNFDAEDPAYEAMRSMQ